MHAPMITLADPSINVSVKRKAAQYNDFVNSLKEQFTSHDPKTRERAVRASRALVAGMLNPRDRAAEHLATKMLGPSNVHVDTALANVSVQYKNEEYIGDELLPMVPVDKLSNVYFKYDKRSRLAAPDDEIGARTSPNEINDARSTDNYSCKPYGLKNFVDVQTLENEDAALNEMIDLVEAINDVLDLKKEIRQAAILGTSANYGSNTSAVSSGNRWDTVGGGTIIADIQKAVAALWTGRGPSKRIGFCSLDVWNVIARNPVIRDMFKFTSGQGIATPAMVAGYFDLDDILVGRARKDTANEGQAASYSRIWPDVFGVVRVAARPSLRNASFGYTMRFKGRKVTNEWFREDVGAEGGYWARVSFSDDYKIVAADTGYLLTTVIN